MAESDINIHAVTSVVFSDDSELETESAEVGTSDEGERDIAQVRLIYNHNFLPFLPLHLVVCWLKS